MNREIAEKWIETLPKYMQTTEQLGFKAMRCCLGVLCDMAVEAGVIPAPTIESNGIHVYAGQTVTLPAPVRRWAEMASNNGTYFENGAEYSLAVDNDDGMPFSEIAVIIREHIDDL